MPRSWRILTGAAALAVLAGAAHAQPELPEGLDGGGSGADPSAGGPALPEGLGGAGPSDGPSDGGDGGPALPEGLGGGAPGDGGAAADTADPADAPAAGLLDAWRIGGYLDTRIGTRIGDKTHQERLPLAESRLELKGVRSWDAFTLTLRGHLVADPIAEEHVPDLETGQGAFDLREASVLWRATSFLDVKAGRQILTWGTGEFVFLNDLFPKDFKSFFIGRRDTMLKAPSDAVKASFYTEVANLDLVYTPQFDPDRFPDGDRLNYFNPVTRQIEGDNRRLDVAVPDDVFDTDEWAARLHRKIGRYGAALYFYDGYWKSPNALASRQGPATFTRLRSYGASVEGPVPRLGGIGNLEVAYYDSIEDRAGRNPLVPNDQVRLLLGWDRELAKNLTGSVQYFETFRLDGPPAGTDSRRTEWTVKLQKSWPEEQVTATVFAFYSPTDQDAYIRPRVSWSPTDRWTLEAGVNWLVGNDDSTRYARFEENTNAFVAARFGF